MSAQLTAEKFVHRNGRSLGWLATAFGLTIVLCHIESGRDRWAAAVWTYALAVPGSPATWGVFILAAGLTILFGCKRDRPRLRISGCWVAFLWFCSLDTAATAALVADYFDDNPANVANPLSIIAWTCIAAMYRVQIKDERA